MVTSTSIERSEGLSKPSATPLVAPFSLKGETALITGGGTGIGFAIAHCMAMAGASVVLVGRREHELAKSAKTIGEKATWLAWDVTELERGNDLIEGAERAANASISILVNNAGIHLKKSWAETTTSEFQAVLNTHVLAAHALTRAVLPDMILRQHGKIIFIASMASFFGIPKVLAYAAAKSAYVGMVRTLAAEISNYGICVNAIAPGWIDTEMSRKAMEEDSARKERILARTPLRRFGKPEEIGWAAVYLCSPAASFVTGTVLPVDGGVSIGF